MKQLLLMRHAKSDWYAGVSSDHSRPLNKRGKEDAKRMGELAKKQEMLPEFVYVSSAQRTIETYQIWADASGFKGPVAIKDELYLSSASQYLEQLTMHEGTEDSLMMLGHNPVMEDLISLLVFGKEAPGFVVPTGAMALLEISVGAWGRVRAGSASLKWFLYPRFVKSLL